MGEPAPNEPQKSPKRPKNRVLFGWLPRGPFYPLGGAPRAQMAPSQEPKWPPPPEWNWRAPSGCGGGPHGALGLWGLCLLWNGTCVAFALLLIMYNLKLEAWSR